MEGCIFCSIVGGKTPVDKVYEDDKVIAFKDINQQAPTHILIIPKEHIPTLLDIREKHQELIGWIHIVASRLAKEFGIADDGFRVVNNCNDYGGQSVFHIHFHLLGGRRLQWPPG